MYWGFGRSSLVHTQNKGDSLMMRNLTLEYPLRANLADWDNDPRRAPYREEKMTFSYALIADGGIVLVADSQVTHTHSIHSGRVVGTYEGRRPKLRRLADRTVLSISGSRGFVDALLLRAEREKVRPDQEYEKLVDAYQFAFRKELHENY